MNTIEDQQLREEIEILVKNIQNEDQKISQNAIELLSKNVQPGNSSTATATLAKTTKFIRPFLEELKMFHERLEKNETQMKLADVLSLLVMTSGEKQESLKFKMMGHIDDLEQWGHEYVQNLTGEIVVEWQKNINEEDGQKSLNESGMDEIDIYTQRDISAKNIKMIPLIEKIVEFHVNHNAEQDAFDLCLEVNQLHMLEKFCETIPLEKLILYAISCAQYYIEPIDKEIYMLLLRLTMKQKKWSDAVRLMIKLNDFTLLTEVIESNQEDEAILKQIGYLLSQIRDETKIEMITNDIVKEAMINTKLSTYFDLLIEALQIKDPKTPQ